MAEKEMEKEKEMATHLQRVGHNLVTEWHLMGNITCYKEKATEKLITF